MNKDEIKANVNVIDFLEAEGVSLKKTGSAYLGFCPFHDNKHTPAFAAWPATQTWHCFGCGKGGDIFSFVQEKRGLDFVSAVEYVAEKNGLVFDNNKVTGVAPEVYDLLEQAASYYAGLLRLNNPALRYLEQRGLNAGAIRAFGIGWADGNFCKGRPADLCRSAGLMTDAGRDRFYNRIVFPIKDRRGRVVGFGGRRLDGQPPKYLNSPETAVFRKGSLLFGWEHIPSGTKRVIVTEGYFDAAVLRAHGYPAVAMLGTAVNGGATGWLARFERVYLAFDNDKAGKRAARTLAKRLLPFTDVFYVNLPDDPDEAVLAGTFGEHLRAARPVLEILVARVKAAQDASARADAIAKALEYIDLLPPVKRAVWRAEVGEVSGVLIDEIVTMAEAKAEAERKVVSEEEKAVTFAETFAAWLLENPLRLFDVKAMLYKAGLDIDRVPVLVSPYMQAVEQSLEQLDSEPEVYLLAEHGDLFKPLVDFPSVADEQMLNAIRRHVIQKLRVGVIGGLSAADAAKVVEKLMEGA